MLLKRRCFQSTVDNVILTCDAGTMMGNVISLPVAGLLCQYGFSEGWDSVFYVIGERLLTAFHEANCNSVLVANCYKKIANYGLRVPGAINTRFCQTDIFEIDVVRMALASVGG